MKKNLKYIKVVGKLKSRGEYDMSFDEYRPYEAVTIVDNEGVEIHFHTLSISKRLDESLHYDSLMTFYILRFRQKKKMFGVLYAAECGGSKLYYPETAIPDLKALGMRVRTRYAFLGNAAGAVSFISGVGLIAWLINLFTDYEFWLTSLLLCGGLIFYVCSPLILQSKGAGLSEMLGILKSDGFNTTSDTNSKY